MSPTKSTIIYNKWDIILVNFPFTDFRISKKRPALIISPEEYNKSEDLVIAFITSNIPEKLNFSDYILQDWKGAGLLKPSILKMKFATIKKTIVTSKLGYIQDINRTNIEKLLQDFSK